MLLSLLLLYLLVLLSLLLLQQIGLTSVVFISVFKESMENFFDFPRCKELNISGFFPPLSWVEKNLTFCHATGNNMLFVFCKCVMVVRHAAEWQLSHSEWPLVERHHQAWSHHSDLHSLSNWNKICCGYSQQTSQPVYSLTLLKSCCQSQ